MNFQKTEFDFMNLVLFFCCASGLYAGISSLSSFISWLIFIFSDIYISG